MHEFLAGCPNSVLGVLLNSYMKSPIPLFEGEASWNIFCTLNVPLWWDIAVYGLFYQFVLALWALVIPPPLVMH
jgi:hypothetical protein